MWLVSKLRVYRITVEDSHDRGITSMKTLSHAQSSRQKCKNKMAKVAMAK